MAEITKTDEAGSKSVLAWGWMGFAILTVFSYIFGLTIPFLGPDEPRYAEVAREMFERGDWITPTLGGFNWFEKPPLLYWLEIAAYKVFGISEFAARLGPALFGLGTVLSLWILGRFYADTGISHFKGQISKTENQRPKTDFANWLALIAASTLGIFVFAHGASFDIIVTFPLTAAMVSFYVFDRRSSRKAPVDTTPGTDTRRREILSLVLFYFFIGVAVLAKGLIGIVFPYAIVAFYYLLSRRMPTARFLASLFWGTLLATAVAATWYLPMYLKHGWPFIDEFFIQHHFQRFTTNKYQHPQPFYFFFWVLPLMTLPWLPFFIGGIWKSIRDFFHRRVARTQREDESLAFYSSPLLLFSFAWLVVPLVFFSFSGSKLPGYILPAVPPAIVIAAVYVFGLVEQSRAWVITVFATACAVFVISLVLLLTVVPRFADSDSAKGLIEAANARGYTNERVFGLHAISQGAEFYAAGRLLRDPEGRQKKLYSPAEVTAEMQRAGVKRALVIVPLEYVKQLTESGTLRSEVIKDNTELAIVAVSLE